MAMSPALRITARSWKAESVMSDERLQKPAPQPQKNLTQEGGRKKVKSRMVCLLAKVRTNATS